MDVLIEAAIKRAYDAPNKTDITLFKENAKTIWNGVQEGYAKKMADMKPYSAEHELALQLKHNAHVISAFKMYQNGNDVAAQILDENGNLRTFSQFKAIVKPMLETFNKNHLQAEYQTAVAAARAAQRWQKLLRDGVTKIRYKTQGDGVVRDAHALLNNVTLPITDPFWSKYAPINGNRCRCYVREVPDNEPNQQPTDLPEIKGFENNPGISGKIVSDTYPYFKTKNKAQATKATAALLGLTALALLSPKQIKERKTLFEKYEADNDNLLIYSNNQTGGYLFQHKNADKGDLNKNINAGKILADDGNAVLIRKHTKKGSPKNPELEVNGVVSDLKTPSKLTSINNGFAKATKQQITEFVAELVLNFTKAQIIKGVDTGFTHNPTIKAVYLVKDKKVIKISRQDWVDLKYIDRINELF